MQQPRQTDHASPLIPLLLDGTRTTFFPKHVPDTWDFLDYRTVVLSKSPELRLRVSVMKESVSEAVFEDDERLPACRRAVGVGAGNPEHEGLALDQYATAKVFCDDATDRNAVWLEPLCEPRRQRLAVDAWVRLLIFTGFDSQVRGAKRHMVANHTCLAWHCATGNF